MATTKRTNPITRRRNFKAKGFRARRAYTFADIAEILGVHVGTVQRWRAEGLTVLDEETKPFLVMGRDLLNFLKAQAQSRKKPLQPGEFYCPRCRKQTRSLNDHVMADFTGRPLGPRYKQVILRGICVCCAQPVLRFSSDGKFADLLRIGLSITQRNPGLVGTRDSSVNVEMLEGEQREQCKREK